MHNGFDGLVCVVTGGAAGIGAAIAERLLVEGAKVAVLDIRPAHAPGGTLALAADMVDDRSVRTAVEEVVRRLGGIDVLVNNAGIGAQGRVEDNSEDEWRRVLDVNVLGIVRLTRAALPYLRRSQWASVVNTCSVAATVGLPERALYSASKGAVLALTRAMATDFVGEGIRVNCVSPGTADTPWVDRLLAAAVDPASERVALEARQPTGRLVSPCEVADAVAYLASPRSGSTTGLNLAVDGGMAALRPRGAGDMPRQAERSPSL